MTGYEHYNEYSEYNEYNNFIQMVNDYELLFNNYFGTGMNNSFSFVSDVSSDTVLVFDSEDRQVLLTEVETFELITVLSLSKQTHKWEQVSIEALEQTNVGRA